MSAGTGEVTPSSLFGRIRSFCLANSDEKTVIKYAKYFKEGYDAYGVDGQLLSDEAKRIFKENRDALGIEGFLDLCDLLMESGKYEEAGLAVRFMRLFDREFSQYSFDRVGAWFDGKVINWAVSDSLCADILSPMLSRNVVTLEDYGAWRESPNRWKRRAVPVSMLILLKGQFDPAALLNFVHPLMLDKERVVHQGLGWFLREIWKVRPVETETFLAGWKDTAARLIFQYATEKMTPEQKAKFRRAAPKKSPAS